MAIRQSVCLGGGSNGQLHHHACNHGLHDNNSYCGGFMGNYIALIMFGCFMVLCSYSYGRISPVAKYATTVEQVIVWRTKKAAQIAEIWSITPEELDKPIAIFK